MTKLKNSSIQIQKQMKNYLIIYIRVQGEDSIVGVSVGCVPAAGSRGWPNYQKQLSQVVTFTAGLLVAADTTHFFYCSQSGLNTHIILLSNNNHF